jgi:hypothetical protein
VKLNDQVKVLKSPSLDLNVLANQIRSLYSQELNDSVFMDIDEVEGNEFAI